MRQYDRFRPPKSVTDGHFRCSLETDDHIIRSGGLRTTREPFKTFAFRRKRGHKSRFTRDSVSPHASLNGDFSVPDNSRCFIGNKTDFAQYVKRATGYPVGETDRRERRTRPAGKTKTDDRFRENVDFCPRHVVIIPKSLESRGSF